MRIEDIRVSAYTVPTETPESDGTLQWDKTTMILVEVTAGGKQGIGYSYADVSTGKLIVSLLADVVKGMNALDVPGAHAAIWGVRESHRWLFRQSITPFGI
jgi:hypothetical protein